VRRVVVLAVLCGCGRFGFDPEPGGAPADGASPAEDSGSAITCTQGYVPVEPLAGYTTSGFCVAKYEMRDVGGVATSTAQGTPWVMTSTNASIAACQALGYELVTNAQWQTMARQMADTDWNWSSGVAYQGVLSTGHSDDAPDVQIAASTDDDPCASTGQSCSETVWHKQRRTARLSNGSVLWDLAGNAGEWVRGTYSGPKGPDAYVAELGASDPRAGEVGNDQVCADPATTPYCGLGMAFFNAVDTAMIRGSGLDWGSRAGAFSAALWFDETDADWNSGFRCAYEP
jgi:hypothetical protein